MSREDFRRAVWAEPVDLGLACLLMCQEVNPDLDVSVGLAELDRLASGVPAADRSDPAACALALHSALGAFGGSADDYADPRATLLHEVLRRQRGLPILLSVVWLEVARRAGLPAFPIGLPGHFLVGVGTPKGPHAVVDVFTSGTMLDSDPPDSRPYDPREVVLRVLNNVRAQAAARPVMVESSRTALWATELSLLLPRHPVQLRRELGVLLVQVGDFVRGATELEAYADAVAQVDAPGATQSRQEARMARSRLN